MGMDLMGMRVFRQVGEGRRRYGLRHYLRRYGRNQWDRAVHRLHRNDLARAFRRLGVESGTTVCVHASLSRLGFVVGGPQALIDALLEVLGPRGTLMMPSFAAPRSALEYLDSGEVFDVRRTPSRSGAVTEAFRTRPEVRRSLHPTNAVAATGPGAEALLATHEKSATPFGPETPYGRLAESDDGFVLMLETHIHSLLHHLQERVDLPTLFLPETRQALVRDHRGGLRKVATRVTRPRIPYFVAIPSAKPDRGPDWAILHDFALIFPARRDAAVRNAGYTFDGYPRLFRRRHELAQRGILRNQRVGRGESGLLRVKPFVARVETEYRRLIARFRDHYDPDHIGRLNLPYF